MQEVYSNLSVVIESTKEFVKRKIQPFVGEWDEKQEVPRELFNQLGDLGLMGCVVPEEYGGSGMDYYEYTAVIAEIAKVDPSIGLTVAAHNSLCTGHILAFGNEDQKQKWLPKLATAEWMGAWGLTEHNTGSDAQKMRTTAELQSDGSWILNGTKNFITNGKSGDIAVVIAKAIGTGTDKNLSAFVVERGTKGFNAGKKEDKLGMRASETAEMVFDNCHIPAENILGEVGDGFKQSLALLDSGRISIAALSIGIAEGALNASIKYANEREQFGKKIISFQGISFKLAEMATEIEASKALLDRCIEKKNSGENYTKLSAMSKLYASETAVKVANEAVQVHGGYGYTKDFPVEKFYRDAKLCTIGEGTSEIQKLVIARQISNI